MGKICIVKQEKQKCGSDESIFKQVQRSAPGAMWHPGHILVIPGTGVPKKHSYELFERHRRECIAGLGHICGHDSYGIPP